MVPVNNVNLIELLETELTLMENASRDRSDRAARNPNSAFRDSILCINNWFFPEHPQNTCEHSVLMGFVPDQHKNESVPCHYIPLNKTGDTVKSLQQEGNQERLAGAATEWLWNTILRLKEELAESQRGTRSAGAA